MATELDAALRRLLLREEVEAFLHHEADLLDARRFEDWLALFSEDVRIFMPLSQNVAIHDDRAARTAEGIDSAWMDEGIETLRQRVAQLATNVHWAEEPASRTTHMISNLQLTDIRPAIGHVMEVDIRCRFLVHRNRNQDETTTLIGKRNDQLRRDGDDWRIARREIQLDQNVLLVKNLSVFF